jgi:SAM-dependent methyltransferase
MRYWPVLSALPICDGVVCEIGSGPAGLATWTQRPIIGIDPGPDDRHGVVTALPNLRRLVADAAGIPLPDESVCAAVAVDTLEHIPAHARGRVVAEMIRVTQRRGRVIIIGPTGPEAAEGDRWLLRTLYSDGGRPDWSVWLEEHIELGLPTAEDLNAFLDCRRVNAVRSAGYLNLTFWRMMHLAARSGPRLGPLHGPVWQPFASVAWQFRRPPFYRWMFVAELT